MSFTKITENEQLMENNLDHYFTVRYVANTIDY